LLATGSLAAKPAALPVLVELALQLLEARLDELELARAP
jgi:hypothetical protein